MIHRWAAARSVAAIAAVGLMAATSAIAELAPPIPDYGPRLERFDYPWPVRMMTVDIGGASAEMAYMDLIPDTPNNGRAVVLLHGKNFCGASWESTARALFNAGYRVLIPDQIGFCKSSKPASAQYTLAMMANATRQLMRERGVASATIVGHSLGGMLAMRFAILFPQTVERLVLVNPLGLVDRAEEGAPYTPLPALLDIERKATYASIKAYEQKNYYHGAWSPAFDRWVWMQKGMTEGPGRDAVWLAQAKTSEMIYTQPVAHELGRITPPVTMLIGTADDVAFGRGQVPPTLQAFMKAIPLVAPAAARKMRNATLVRLEGLGHAPQIEAPAAFEKALLAAIRPPRPRG